MADRKTKANPASVAEFLNAVEHPGRREDALVLNKLFCEVTGYEPVMWGASIVGYGRYDYTYESGLSGSSLATGFSPRKANLVVYTMPGYSDFGPILDRLGPHKLGKSCLYLGRLNKIDLDALGELIRAGLADLGTRRQIHPK
ncbi:MAG: DUF1801 domain-containing protein [Rhizobiaceae bacterium]|nr:DUF1801 domain-containing protein [Rhizobiaceae bacterium]